MTMRGATVTGAAFALLFLAALPEQGVGQQAERTVSSADREGLPLEPGRRLSYTATEGSWLSVDVSPDGTTLVFDHLGDLFTVPISGGRASRLTRGMGFDAQPRFSPDGEHVVFTSDRDGGENLWILSLDLADTVQLTRGGHERYQGPEWTPDGDYVVATKGTKLHLWHRDGGAGAQLVTEPENLRTIGAAFGTDARYVWFGGRRAQGSLYNNGLDLYQLYVYDRETGEVSPRSDRWGGASVRLCRRTVGGSCTDRGTSPTPGSGSGIWRPVRSDGSRGPCSVTTRSPARRGTCTRA